MKIYIVIHIDTNDSDIHIAGCFSNREKAEAYIDEMKKTHDVIEHVFYVE